MSWVFSQTPKIHVFKKKNDILTLAQVFFIAFCNLTQKLNIHFYISILSMQRSINYFIVFKL